METELKLLIAPADVAPFRRLALLKQLATAKPATRLLHNTYFDTPELLLQQHGLQLRVRRVGRVAIQTLKTAGQAAEAGLHQRQEWEARVAGLQPELESLIEGVEAGSAWQKLLCAPGLAQRLAPIFGSEVRRTLWNLRLAQGVEVELALDQGALKHGDKYEPISEVELELKAGEPAALFDLALQLQEQVPLRVGNLSKAARGYALLAPAAADDVAAGVVADVVAGVAAGVAAGAVAVKAAPVVLNRDMSVEAGFRVIVSNCLQQMQDNEAGVVRGAGPECIHQMRVGMRRLRSALRLFAPWMVLPPALQQELCWLGGELGAARDADVLADDTLPKVIEACPQEAGLLALRELASTVARHQRQRAAEAVASVRHARLVLGLVGWLQASRWRESLDEAATAALAEPLRKRASQMLARRHQKLIKSGKRLAHATPDERHRVRIAAKKARYATEFFRSLHPAGRVKRYLQQLAALQESLGWLNDATVADRLLQEIGLSHPALAGGAAFTRGHLGATTRQDLPGLRKLWKHLRAMTPP